MIVDYNPSMNGCYTVSDTHKISCDQFLANSNNEEMQMKQNKRKNNATLNNVKMTTSDQYTNVKITTDPNPRGFFE